MGEVLFAVVHGLELAAIDRDLGVIEQMHISAQRDEPAAHISDRSAVVLSKVGNRLEVRRELASEPHQLDVAGALALQASRRLDLIEVAVEVDLEHRCWMISGPAGCLRQDVKAQLI